MSTERKPESQNHPNIEKVICQLEEAGVDLSVDGFDIVKEELDNQDLDYKNFGIRLCLGEHNYNPGSRQSKKQTKASKVVKSKTETDKPKNPGTSKQSPEEKLRKLLIKQPENLSDIATYMKMNTDEVFSLIEDMKKRNYMIEMTDAGKFSFRKTPEEGTDNPIVIDVASRNTNVYRFGFISDTHYGSKFCRHDVCEAMYDIFEDEGITEVYHGGNWIDGQTRFNNFELTHVGFESQVFHFADAYPRRENIKTFIIDGDDHEAWFAQREGIHVGKRMEQTAREMGRTDLIYSGFIETDFMIATSGGPVPLRVMHGGGGSAYSLGYRMQKIIESWTPGEKPRIFLCGHYHKYFKMYYRGVWGVLMGCCQDQTRFMRKKSLPAHIGGGIVTVTFGPNGEITSFTDTFYPFYDRKWYTGEEDDPYAILGNEIWGGR